MTMALYAFSIDGIKIYPQEANRNGGKSIAKGLALL